MPLFVCDRCHAVENTALSNFWSVKHKLCHLKDPELDGKFLCSECFDGKFADGSVAEGAGRWHNHFPKDIATAELIKEIGESNFVYIPEGVFEGVRARHCCRVLTPEEEKLEAEREAKRKAHEKPRRIPEDSKFTAVARPERMEARVAPYRGVDPYAPCPCGSGKKYKFCCRG